MWGKPKYKIGDKVSFKIDKDIYTGSIYIIDPYGTWDNDSDVSYDIMVYNWGPTGDKECLFKHITETLIIEDEDKNTSKD